MELAMDESVKAALKVYGRYLDGELIAMDKSIIEAIRTIREYVYLRDPHDEDIHRTIITAKRKQLTGSDLESFVMKVGTADRL
jgi:hypothetical protein